MSTLIGVIPHLAGGLATDALVATTDDGARPRVAAGAHGGLDAAPKPDATAPTRSELDETEGRETESGEIVGVAFASLRPALVRYLSGLLGGREDAEDVAQETYLKVREIPRDDLRFGTLRALIFKVATNLAYDRFRARRVRGTADDAALAEIASDAPAPEHIVGFEQGLALIKQTLLELEPRCRDVFLMRVHAGLDYDDIAARLGISKRTVEREMAHALDACQRRLQGDRA